MNQQKEMDMNHDNQTAAMDKRRATLVEQQERLHEKMSACTDDAMYMDYLMQEERVQHEIEECEWYMEALA